MIALKINDQWAVFSEDQSVTIEENSPVWGEGNTFSLPFELDVEANRHIVGNSDQLTGMSVYDVLEGKSVVLYVMGIPLFFGKLSLEDEVEISEGKIEVSLVSSTLAFDDMIDGMNCQDVELTEEIVLGERWSEFSVKIMNEDKSFQYGEVQSYFPRSYMRMRNNGQTTVNVSTPYPGAKYCNTRICYELPEQPEDAENTKIVQHGVHNDDSNRVSYETIFNNAVKGKYVALDAERPLSAPCFYVRYFLDCLFARLGIDADFGKIDTEEDILRLAFVTTQCNYIEKSSDIVEEFKLYVINSKISDRPLFKGYLMENGSMDYPLSLWWWNGDDYLKEVKPWAYVQIPVKKCVASSENFPDTEVSTVIESMTNAFGIRFLFNRNMSSVTLMYVRDILTSNEIKDINVEILSVHKQESAVRGFVLKYNGDDEDTSFNYNEWGNYELIKSYNALQPVIGAYNKKLYIDNRNGNAYRIKVDSEATDTEELTPSLFEVGMFNAVKYGDCSDEKRIEEVSIPFTPIVMNDVEFVSRKEKIDANVRKRVEIDDSSYNQQEFSAFIDVSMEYPGMSPINKIGGYATYAGGLHDYEISFASFDMQRYDETFTDQSLKKIRENRKEHRSKFGTPVAQKYLDNDSPIQTYDVGFTLGIMRGPGNTSGIEDYDENYDDEGGAKYVTVPTNYAFHSDTVDNYARVFDYNGTGDGGVDTSGRFSLKLRAEKPYPEELTDAMKAEIANLGLQKWSDGRYYHPISESHARRRGLFDKFYTEYAYFVTHRKIARLTLRMEIADLVNIDWTKRYRIGQFVGFVNHYSYTVNANGISEVEMELYYI